MQVNLVFISFVSHVALSLVSWFCSCKTFIYYVLYISQSEVDLLLQFSMWWYVFQLYKSISTNYNAIVLAVYTDSKATNLWSVRTVPSILSCKPGSPSAHHTWLEPVVVVKSNCTLDWSRWIACCRQNHTVSNKVCSMHFHTIWFPQYLQNYYAYNDLPWNSCRPDMHASKLWGDTQNIRWVMKPWGYREELACFHQESWFGECQRTSDNHMCPRAPTWPGNCQNKHAYWMETSEWILYRLKVDHNKKTKVMSFSWKSPEIFQEVHGFHPCKANGGLPCLVLRYLSTI